MRTGRTTDLDFLSLFPPEPPPLRVGQRVHGKYTDLEVLALTEQTVTVGRKRRSRKPGMPAWRITVPREKIRTEGE